MPRPRRWAPSSSSSRRRMQLMPTTPPTRATPTSKTSAACNRAQGGSAKGLPDGSGGPFSLAGRGLGRAHGRCDPRGDPDRGSRPPRRPARAADGRAQRRHGLCRRRISLSRRPDRRGRCRTRARQGGRSRGNSRDRRGNRGAGRPGARARIAKPFLGCSRSWRARATSMRFCHAPACGSIWRR